MDNKIKVVISLALALSPVLTVLGQAQPPVVPPPLGGPGPIASPDDVIALVRQILVWLAIIFWVAATIMIFVAGFRYLTAQGDDEKIKKAKSTLIYAIVAIVIGLMAYAIPTFVDRFLRGRG